MNIIKILFWGFILSFMTLIILQNPEFFAPRQDLKLSLMVWEYKMPEVPKTLVCVAFFIIGVLSMYLTNVVERFRAKKAIRTLNRTCDAQIEEIGILKGRLNRYSGERLVNSDSPLTTNHQPLTTPKPEPKPESQTS